MERVRNQAELIEAISRAVAEAVDRALAKSLANQSCACNLETAAHHHFHEGATRSLEASEEAVEAIRWAVRARKDLEHYRKVGLRTVVVILIGAAISALYAGLKGQFGN